MSLTINNSSIAINRTSFLKSSSFRISLIIVFSILIFSYASVAAVRYLVNQWAIEEVNSSEWLYHEVLERVEQSEGAKTAIYANKALNWLQENEYDTNGYYCNRIVTSNGKVLYSNIDHYQKTLGFSEKIIILELKEEIKQRSDEYPLVCALVEFEFPNGDKWLTGESFFESLQLLKKIDEVSWIVLGVNFFLSILIGGFIGQRSYKRLDEMNRLCYEIESGKLNTRIKERGTNDDFDQLARNINKMLDKLDRLTEVTRNISDSIAHDLKTPMTKLRGKLELLQGLDEKNPEIELMIIEQADQIIETFNSLLRIAKVRSGSSYKNFEKINISKILEDSIELYQPAFEEKSIAMKIDIAKALTIKGDANLWMQVFVNIFDNTLKYANESPLLMVSLIRKDHKMELIIKDTGQGIPEHCIDKVFEHFFRVYSETKIKGTGLGLSLVGAVCDLHQAEINLENESGLKITILLPLEY